MPKAAVSEFDPNDLYPVPENTLVPVQLQGCEQVIINFTKKDGKPGSMVKWEWTFLVYDGDYAGTTLRGTTEPKITNAAERTFLPLARPYVEALLGRDLELGEEVDTDLLIGYKAMATVRHLEPRARKNGDGFWYNVEVDEVFPGYGENVTGAATPAAAPDPWATPNSYGQIPY